MDSLPVDDVRGIVRLLGEVAALATDLPGKRRFLMIGLAKLIDADIWVWIHLKDQAKDGIPIGFMFLDGGWQNETQRMKYAEATISPAAESFNNAMRIGCDVHRTRRLVDLLWDKQQPSSDSFLHCLNKIGISDSLSSLYPLGNKVFSSVGFLRGLGRPAFTARDVCIAHIVVGEIDWLHREGTDVPAAEHVNDLSLRQRQVLLQLLAGDSVKQIAGKLSISAYTVNDHIKNIYRHFAVNGRGELLAQFLAGGPTSGSTPGDTGPKKS
jgi:DNA-binding CsgD family transcriptional regulator